MKMLLSDASLKLKLGHEAKRLFLVNGAELTGMPLQVPMLLHCAHSMPSPADYRDLTDRCVRFRSCLKRGGWWFPRGRTSSRV